MCNVRSFNFFSFWKLLLDERRQSENTTKSKNKSLLHSLAWEPSLEVLHHQLYLEERLSGMTESKHLKTKKTKKNCPQYLYSLQWVVFFFNYYWSCCWIQTWFFSHFCLFKFFSLFSLFSSIRFSSLDSMRKEYRLLPPAGETVSLRYLWKEAGGNGWIPHKPK